MSASPPSAGSARKRPAPRGTAAYPRKRANKACQVCRSRRTKCDNKRPSCSFCEKAGTACVYAPEDLSSFDPASLAILDRFDRLESILLSNGASNQSNWQRSIDSPAPASIPEVTEFEANLGCVQSSLVDVRLEAVLQWSPIRDCLALKVLPSRTLPAPADHYQQTNVLGDEFDMSTCNNLLENFWNGVHSKNPILNKDEIRRLMHRMCLHGISWDAQSCLVLLICALGTLATDFGPYASINEEDGVLRASDKRRVAEARQYFGIAQKRLGVCLGRRGVLEAQCFFYCGVYHVTMMEPDAAWSMFLQALACCQGFRCLSRTVLGDDSPLSLDPTIDTMTMAEECTYWTCLKSELESHLDLSPPGFRTIDLWYPQKFPDPPRDMITHSDRSWFFYLAEIALRRLANRIMASNSKNFDLNDPRQAKAAFEIGVAFEQEAQDWINSLPSPNELQRYSEDVLNFILKGHLVNCYELIYWPFVKHAINISQRDPANDDFVRKGLQVAVERIEINQPGFRHRHHGTYGMIKSVTRSALVLLAARLSHGLEDMTPSNLFELLARVDDLLQYWQDDLAGAETWRAMMKVLLDNVSLR